MTTISGNRQIQIQKATVVLDPGESRVDASQVKRPKSFMELCRINGSAVIPVDNTNQYWKKDWNIGARYTIQRIMGNGSYGDVAKAYDNERKEIVRFLGGCHS